jgi:hypothetical protein
MTWVEHLGAPEAGFKPFKHRKFVDRLTGTPAAMRAVLALTHDGLRGDASITPEAAAAFDSAVAKDAAAGGGDGASAVATVTLDYHAFHTSVVPKGKKAASK